MGGRPLRVRSGWETSEVRGRPLRVRSGWETSEVGGRPTVGGETFEGT